MPEIGVPELVIILVIVLIIFGPGKLAGAGTALGQAIREFRQGVAKAETKPGAAASEMKDENEQETV